MLSDSLIGSLPNLYYYAANNPSEATIAKEEDCFNRGYLTPPAENAGLYKGLKELSEPRWFLSTIKKIAEIIQIVNAIVETSKQCNLDKDVELPSKA